MPDFLKLVKWRPSDALGRGVGTNERGIARFEILKTPKKPIVFRIGNERVVEHVVPMGVFVENRSEIGCDSLGLVEGKRREIDLVKLATQCGCAFEEVHSGQVSGREYTP